MRFIFGAGVSLSVDEKLKLLASGNKALIFAKSFCLNSFVIISCDYGGAVRHTSPITSIQFTL